MDYLSLNVVPRADGSWFATVAERSTRSVRGVPRVLRTSRPIDLPGMAGMTLEQVAATALNALRRTSG